MAYVGFEKCGCAVAVVVDSDEHRQVTSEGVAEFIADGLTVERRPVEWVRQNLARCTHK